MARQQPSEVQEALEGARANSAGWARGNCPYCVSRVGKRDRSRALSYNVDTGCWHCFRCGAGGNAGANPDAERQPLENPELGEPESFVELGTEPGWSALSLGNVRAYLAGRRVSRRTMLEVGIGYCLSGRAANRIVVPVQIGGEWRGWSARAMRWGQQPRYLYPPGMNRTGLFFNEDFLDRAEAGMPVIVAEGVFDALPHWPRVIACLGKPGEVQLQRLIACGRPVVFALDGDSWQEGWAYALRCRMEDCQAGAIRFAPKQDPAEVTTEWLLAAVKASLDSRL